MGMWEWEKWSQMPYQIHKIELMMHMYFSIHSLLYYLHSSLSIKPFFCCCCCCARLWGENSHSDTNPSASPQTKKNTLFDAVRHKNRMISPDKIKSENMKQDVGPVKTNLFIFLKKWPWLIHAAAAAPGVRKGQRKLENQQILSCNAKNLMQVFFGYFCARNTHTHTQRLFSVTVQGLLFPSLIIPSRVWHAFHVKARFANHPQFLIQAWLTHTRDLWTLPFCTEWVLCGGVEKKRQPWSRKDDLSFFSEKKSEIILRILNFFLKKGLLIQIMILASLSPQTRLIGWNNSHTSILFFSRPCGKEPIEDISKGDASFPAKKPISAIFSSSLMPIKRQPLQYLWSCDRFIFFCGFYRLQCSCRFRLETLQTERQKPLIWGVERWVMPLRFQTRWSVLKALHNPSVNRRGGCLAPDPLVLKIDHNMFLYFCVMKPAYGRKLPNNHVSRAVHAPTCPVIHSSLFDNQVCCQPRGGETWRWPGCRTAKFVTNVEPTGAAFTLMGGGEWRHSVKWHKGLRVSSCEVWSHNQTSMTTFLHF